MEKATAFLRRYIKYWILMGAPALLLLWFELFKGNRAVMNFTADYITTPVKQGLAMLVNVLPFSMTELLIVLLILFGLFWLAKAVVELCRKPQKGERLLRKLFCVLSAVLLGWSSLTLLWGVNYYTDTFQEKSGITAQAATAEKLAETAAYFAKKVNETAPQVKRDEAGRVAVTVDEIFAGTEQVRTAFDRLAGFLPGSCYQPKPLFFSEVMSMVNCTGFFSPYTGEANINVHVPVYTIPATITHELAHQRAVASEQEANFVAIMVSTESGLPEYEYSGWMLGYVYLNNALASADYDRFAEVYATLSDTVRADLAENSAYWQRYRTPVSELADSISDQRLKSYGQEQGIKSYGAVVDLLIAYYGGGTAD